MGTINGDDFFRNFLGSSKQMAFSIIDRKTFVFKKQLENMRKLQAKDVWNS